MDRDMIKTSVMDWCAGEIRDKVDYDAARVAELTRLEAKEADTNG